MLSEEKMTFSIPWHLTKEHNEIQHYFIPVFIALTTYRMFHYISPCLCSLFLNFPILQMTSRYYPPIFLFTWLFIVYIISFAFCFFFCNAHLIISLLCVLPLDACGSSFNPVSLSSVTYVNSTQFLFLSNCSLSCRESKKINSD